MFNSKIIKMEILKEECLKKINCSFSEMCNAQPLGIRRNNLGFKVRQILNIIIDLSRDDKSMDYMHIFSNLSHTLGKEVAYADYAYQRMTKKNAAKLRQQEYESELSLAIDQIRMDISGLLLK